MASNRGDEKPVGDWPKITENHWYSLAITSAIFTAVAVLGAFLCIFWNGFDGENDREMAQALAPFGVALFALVTFCTASWRGSINTRQANQAESEGRAKLLQEGAKLLSESGKASHVSAGVATLGVLVAGNDGVYAFQAMNLLADFVEDHMHRSHANRHRPEISGVMRSGDENGANTRREISFDCTSDDEDPRFDDEVTYWSFIPGFKTINYFGGKFDYDDHYKINELVGVNFRNVEIANWRPLIVDDRFYRCTFTMCDIVWISSLLSSIAHSDFKYAFNGCNFSGCEIADHNFINIDLKEGKNYYVAGEPPILLGSKEVIDWSEILICEERKRENRWPF